MEETRERIVKTSKIIQLTANIGLAVLGFFAVLGLFLVFIASSGDKFLSEKELSNLYYRIVEGANLLPIDVMHFFFGDTRQKMMLIFSGACVTVMIAIIMYCVWESKRIFKNVIESRTPFTPKTYEEFRKLSLKALPLIFFSTLLGVFVFLMIRLMSYIFEYGTYLQDKADETNRIQEEMIMSFAEITENKSEQTGKHVRRVAEYSRIMAMEMGIEEDQANLIRLASTMHDIGKLLIPDAILEKPARLTDEEFDEIKKHPGYGGDLLDNVEGDVMRMSRTVALEHHERPDGNGYPSGKTGDALSIESQIVAVADVYDALTSKRSYKEAWNEKDAYAEIVKGKGTQFNDTVVDAFIKAYPKINDVRVKLQG
ncbi:MAG: HD-GYP domain-containing protein [Oscillospiraceae bacterium]|nr:HD-GYP domain-containing protein [Oscillospiraceae bacterium]